MQRPIGVGGIKARVEQARGQELGDCGMPAYVVFFVGGFVPDITLRRTEIDTVIGADAVGRDNVLFEILVLVIAPNQHAVGLEFVDSSALAAKPMEQFSAMARGGGSGMILPPLLAHRRRPALRSSKFFRKP